MTKSKSVHYRGGGFWAYDVAISILLKYVIDAAEARPSDAESEWLRTEVSDWKAVACISYSFLIDHDETWSARQTALFVSLLEEACSRLEARKTIPALEVENWPMLDDLHLSTRGDTEVVTVPIVELGRAIIALINGSLPEPLEGTLWAYGFPGGRTIIPTAPSPLIGMITLSSQVAPAGGTVAVKIKRFPLNKAHVEFRIGKSGEANSVVMEEKTDDMGTASATITIPTSAVAGEDWVVTAVTSYMSMVWQATSLPIRIV